MVAKVGADVAQLRAAAGRFEASADELTTVLRQVDGAIGELAWAGPKSAAWRTQWQAQDGQHLAAAARLLRDNAAKLRTQADQQEAASQGDTGALAPVPSVTPGGSGTGIDLAGQETGNGTGTGQGHGPQAELHVDKDGVSGSASGDFTGPGNLAGTWGTDFYAGVKTDRSASVSIDSSGLQARYSESASLGVSSHAEVQVTKGPVEAGAEVDAFVGVRTGTDASVTVGPDGVSTKLGYSSFAGGEVSATGHIGAGGVEGSAKVSGWTGVGVKADAEVSLKPDRIVAQISLGAALGLGGSVEFGIDVNPKEVVENLAKVLPWNW